ncbi:metalloregulator ArsR/SmtB family transcription factor [Micromonospora sp. WMMD1102]|uniref:ArsR/SmtB family transcription factor n=1 Tax=Micromonospora sp. WMMD1102 TaxID=3016105 RepID=UPI002414F3AB|nr:metalloregulator ArsR/SmtB family transcription factor [Micromonospora sp. WMMD1102]MDG4790571.1 metalloregulator ArsR/SmtB family transcription factor [Micromonospora sp. WMMD1102]
MGRDTLSTVFAALADPTRRAVLDRLLHGDASVTDLAEPFAMTPRAVSKHVAVLEAAGLVTRARDAQRRPSRIRAEPLADIDTWLGAYRRLWQHRFDQLDERLARLQADGADGRADGAGEAADEDEESRKP